MDDEPLRRILFRKQVPQGGSQVPTCSVDLFLLGNFYLNCKMAERLPRASRAHLQERRLPSRDGGSGGAILTLPLEPASQGPGAESSFSQGLRADHPLLCAEGWSPAHPSQPGSATSSVLKATSTSGTHGVRTAGPRGAVSSKGRPAS